MSDNLSETFEKVVYYNTDHSETKECTIGVSRLLNFTYSTPSRWGSLVGEIENGAKYFLFHADIFTGSTRSTPIEFIDAISTVTSFIPKSQLKKWLSSFDPLKTESENMFDAGHRRYHDCGNFIFEYE